MQTYTVRNVYGINGNTTHKSLRAAAVESRKREGDGWIVEDAEGNQVDFVGNQEIVIRYAND